jgi:hypothetical protein
MTARDALGRWQQSSVLQRVCSEVFGGSRAEMLACARHHLAHGVPSRDLGATFREIVGSRPRGEFWKRAASILEALLRGQPARETVQLSDLEALISALRKVQKYRQKVVVMSGLVEIAAIVPVALLDKLDG